MTDRAALSDGAPSELIDALSAGLADTHHDLPDMITSLADQSSSDKGIDTLEKIVRQLRDRNFGTRADALRRYIGLDNHPTPHERLTQIAQTLVAQADSPESLNTAGIAAVFTAHPTFALANEVYTLLAERAENPERHIPELATHRRAAPPHIG